ncbi:MAG: class I SAM-dependent methyltransferase [Anaerolineales bacterium]|nr:methyltransferase domain-containing protein [Anaerolineae bacterium]PWB50603.1 MAG: class I SAM-dependent methyltransferase [Anaerolineales bacterium]
MNDTGKMDSAEVALSKLEAGQVLDVATGNGGFITFLLDNIKSFTEITGIDLNERPLDAARKVFLQGNIRLLRMDANQMEFMDGVFDTVCIANSLHHLENPDQVLAEMWRVCKTDGTLLICEMYRDGQTKTQQTHVDLHHWWAAVDRADGIHHLETYTRQEILDITQKLGLKAMEYFDMKDLEADPKEPELVKDLDGIIDRYLQRAQGSSGEAQLIERGEELRRRVHATGFHGATSLLVIGRK